MSEIADFLRVRYEAARECVATVHDLGCGEIRYDGTCDCGMPTQLLDDLEAKLAIVDVMDGILTAAEGDSEVDHYGGLSAAEVTLYHLAQPFAGHPDHKGEEWAP